ncbi:Ig-like domain-containing protein [Secundilactobacillus silagei]|uniref:Ig-like domain-containing protein n=1 Tax=Secundilactobacillus silagei TaxID=1293415 RepID=UPI000AD5B096|nr:Ig-like domain-containing protein [Secundilactobacillus silagei]
MIAAFGLLGFGAATTTQASAKTAKPAKTTKTTIVAGSPSLSINKIYSNSTSVTGTASKGTKITVENSKQKQIASSMASKKTGKYTVKLPAKQKAATKLYVYAKYTTNRHYLYRIMTVQAAGSAKTATKKVTTKKSTRKEDDFKEDCFQEDHFKKRPQLRRLNYRHQLVRGSQRVTRALQ